MIMGCGRIYGTICIMIDLFMIATAIVITGWATWPVRGNRRRWLLLGLVVLWGALVGVGWRRGIQPGFAAWLLVLSLIGALVGLLVVWSFTNLVGRGRK